MTMVGHNCRGRGDQTGNGGVGKRACTIPGYNRISSAAGQWIGVSEILEQVDL